MSRKKHVYFGLGNDVSYTPEAIDYGFYLDDFGNIRIVESGIEIGTYGTYDGDDSFIIENPEGQIRYRHNGALIRESSKTEDIFIPCIFAADDNNLVQTFSLYSMNSYAEYEGSLDENIKYYSANDQRIAQNSTRDGLRFFLKDHLGSSTVIVDENGENPQWIVYEPYGKVAESDDENITKYQYTGQENDYDTGLFYYNARYYDPDLCRFIQADTVLDGLNRYTYCHNNPVRYTDPTGNDGVYFCFMFKNTEKDTEYMNRLIPLVWEVIDEIEALGMGIPCETPRYYVTEEEAIQVLESDDAAMVVFFGHGYYEEKGMQTSDRKGLLPSDIEDPGENLSVLILGGCMTDSYKEEWEALTGADIYTNSDFFEGNRNPEKPDIITVDDLEVFIKERLFEIIFNEFIGEYENGDNNEE